MFLIKFNFTDPSSQESNGSRVPRKRGRPPGSTKATTSDKNDDEKEQEEGEAHEEREEADEEKSKKDADEKVDNPIPAKRARSTRAGGTKDKDETPVQEEVIMNA